MSEPQEDKNLPKHERIMDYQIIQQIESDMNDTIKHKYGEHYTAHFIDKDKVKRDVVLLQLHRITLLLHDIYTELKRRE